jgi:hypothetical protein
MPDHRQFVALLAPVGPWSKDQRRIVGDWGVRDRAPIFTPSGDVSGWFTGGGVSPAGLVGVGVLDRTGVYLAEHGHVLEMDLGGADLVGRYIADFDGVEFTGGAVTSAHLGTTPAWPDVWLRLDETVCAGCYAPAGTPHADTCDMAGATT